MKVFASCEMPTINYLKYSNSSVREDRFIKYGKILFEYNPTVRPHC